MTEKLVDIVFVLDATKSTQCVFYGMTLHVEDQTFDIMSKNTKAKYQYGAVIYRDPVSYKPSPTEKQPLSAEEIDQLNRIYAKEKEIRKQKLIEKGIYNEENERRREEQKFNVDRVKFPVDKNVAIPFCDNIETLSIELGKVECDGGNDDQEDWVGALSLALNDFNWREGSKRCIFWISDANAHGKSFNAKGEDNYNEEEPKLMNLTQQMAEKRIYFVGINIKKGTDPGCEKTLNAMKEVYESNGGPSFMIQEFKVTVDPELGNDDWTPTELGDFEKTITQSLRDLGP
ncbi:hypothetical protein M9Y10_008674 [Tritrichomonas musculus]|uniref:VWFA domain-containing protein n=1 Tax=Tritrichomonas musculus TaxID=1915356 RepID=A0ABR2J0M2_9EUKA